ncbi:beta-ketoacyl synthase N-terminal-like domain-containing protein [Edaphocola aurantiacus]|uniref:beta-ketoacyl synthase N-terminal-like domain-containing protein n=1 Tax=Edaphocola aurantiacus TaxID=2601682 RepID=UPI001C96F2DE|nr:beta-ketoacyl synthase N-terminal-like domain-containing protein [Edaphocola aurantiacus]
MIYHVSDAIISPLGFDTDSVYEAVLNGTSAIRPVSFPDGNTFMLGKMQEAQYDALNTAALNGYSRFEQMCIAAIQQALSATAISLTDPDTVLILSTTKGNIEWINDPERKALASIPAAAQRIAAYFKHPNPVINVSVACISGAAAQITARRMLEAGLYKHAVVAGCDVISDFVLAGFNSFQALSDEQCRPFDAERKGLNLGEAAACIVLSTDIQYSSHTAVLSGGSISNDANHLSGPSKTGAELGMAISQSLAEAQLEPQNIGFISAHGTATNYNDEMEAKAIGHAALSAVPVHSLKPYFGHTLGASGLLESIISLKAMEQDTLIPVPGFQESNTSVPLHVITSIGHQPVAHFAKTAAGFGGCNAALVWSKKVKQ